MRGWSDCRQHRDAPRGHLSPVFLVLLAPLSSCTLSLRSLLLRGSVLFTEEGNPQGHTTHPLSRLALGGAAAGLYTRWTRDGERVVTHHTSTLQQNPWRLFLSQSASCKSAEQSINGEAYVSPPRMEGEWAGKVIGYAAITKWVQPASKIQTIGKLEGHSCPLLAS